MASIGITASIHRAYTNKPARPPQSLVVTPNVKLPAEPPLLNPKEHGDETDEQSRPRFSDERWKKGTWDLNMFVKQGRMDWDSVIVAGNTNTLHVFSYTMVYKVTIHSITEAGRRKYLEMHPEASTNDEPVVFRSSIIPWWAWLLHSHLPEAELLNG